VQKSANAQKLAVAAVIGNHLRDKKAQAIPGIYQWSQGDSNS